MKSIRTILLVRLLAGGVILFGLAGFYFQWSITRALRGEFDESLRVASRSLVAAVEQSGNRVNIETDVDENTEYGNPDSSSVFLLRRIDGPEIRRSLSLGDQPLAVPATPVDHADFFNIDLPDHRHLRCMAFRFLPELETPDSPEQTPLPLILVTGRDRQALEATLAKFHSILWATGIGALAAMEAFLWWGVRNGLRPLDQLVSNISAVDANTLSTRFPTESLPTELLPIAIRLNDLLERLEKVFHREKRFTADVAHELRTPLAELRTLAEVNLMIAPESPAGWDEVKSVAGRMESLSLRLLELSRSEQGSFPLQRQRVGVAPAIHAVWSRLTPIAKERDIKLACEIRSTLELETDPVLFEMVLTNLIGNAVHHAATGTVLRIDDGPDALLFTNKVQGLDPQDLPFLFERFWKKDDSRSDGRRHGLGLSLAQDVASLLGGSLSARMPSPSTVQLAFRLPSHSPLPYPG